MNATELIAIEIAKVLSGNDLYNTYRRRWKYLLESYMGGDEYRRAGHLTRYQTETDLEYEARLAVTPLENHCNSIVTIYTSFLFREQPYRELGDLSTDPQLQNFLRDCDYEGRTLDHFLKDLSIWTSVFGHAWMIITKPNLGTQTRADELSLGVRPYLSMLTPLTVLDWEYMRTPMGQYELSYLKYIEEINGTVTTVKEWRPQSIKTYVVDAQKGSYVTEPVEEENQLGMIPAIICYNKRSGVKGIGISDISDIADIQKFIYNATSEVDQSIRLNTHPSLVKTADTIAGIGAGSIIQMEDSLDPGLKPYLLEFNGASINSIYDAINHAVKSIDDMANTGAIRAKEAKTMSGVAMETEFQMLNARLSDKAHSIELAEEQMWRLWSVYMGYMWTGTIVYPNSFNIRDNANDLNLLLTAKTANVPSKTYNNEIFKTIADLTIMDREKLPQIYQEIDTHRFEYQDEYEEEMSHPETTEDNREDHIESMIMEGYTDQQILDIHPEINDEDIQDAKRSLLDLDEE